MEEIGITAFERVFKRSCMYKTTFGTFINDPQRIFNHFGLPNMPAILRNIKEISDKKERNSYKKNNLPSVSLAGSGILSVDIDNIKDKKQFDDIVKKLSNHESCHVVKESVSGNIVAYFKYHCSPDEYKYLYYRLYLELTLLLGINIDFLPEIGRLRYVSSPGHLWINENSTILTQIMKVDKLPYINTSTDFEVKKFKAGIKRGGRKYGSQ